MRVLSATVIYKKEWQCQFYQVCKMKKPQSLGPVWEQKNHSASQPQPAFYFSVTLQSISPFPALLSTRDMFSHSTGVVWYPNKPNHKQSNIFPFRFPSPHKHTCMRGASSGMPGGSYATLLWKSDGKNWHWACYLLLLPLLNICLVKLSALLTTLQALQESHQSQIQKVKSEIQLSKNEQTPLLHINFCRSSRLSCGKWISVQESNPCLWSSSINSEKRVK